MQQAASVIDKAATAYKKYIKSKSPKFGIRNFKTLSLKQKPKALALRQQPLMKRLEAQPPKVANRTDLTTKALKKAVHQPSISNNIPKKGLNTSKQIVDSKKTPVVKKSINTNVQKSLSTNVQKPINIKKSINTTVKNFRVVPSKSSGIPHQTIQAETSQQKTGTKNIMTKIASHEARGNPIVVDSQGVLQTTKLSPTDRQTEEARNLLFQKLKDSRMNRGKSNRKLTFQPKPSPLAQNSSGVKATTKETTKEKTKLAQTNSLPQNIVNKNSLTQKILTVAIPEQQKSGMAHAQKSANTISNPVPSVNKQVKVNLPARNKSVSHRNVKLVAPRSNISQNLKKTGKEKLAKSKPSNKAILKSR